MQLIKNAHGKELDDSAARKELLSKSNTQQRSELHYLDARGRGQDEKHRTYQDGPKQGQTTRHWKLRKRLIQDKEAYSETRVARPILQAQESWKLKSANEASWNGIKLSRQGKGVESWHLGTMTRQTRERVQR